MNTPLPPMHPATPHRRLTTLMLLMAAGLVVGVLVWQAITAQGSPDPTAPGLSPRMALLYISVLVFREGLESILVLAAVTASMVGALHTHRRPVAMGAGVGVLATLATWFLAVRIVSDLTEHLPALAIQAATGLLAVLVLLLVMNWFFHKVYWTGWIALQTTAKRDLLQGVATARLSTRQLLWGLGLLGFASLYREGVEVVLFLQSYYLRLGGGPVLGGVLLGGLLTAIVAVLTFVAHHRLPYRRMLVLTGVLLGGVLVVMVGEQAQEMQLAQWIPATPVASLVPVIPDWVGLWFAVFPTWETLAAQVFAAVLVLGSYWAARSRVLRSGRVQLPGR